MIRQKCIELSRLIALILLLSCHAFLSQAQIDTVYLYGQTAGVNIYDAPKYQLKDSIPQVIYLHEKKSSLNPLFVVNDEVLLKSGFSNINLNKIQNVQVETGRIDFAGATFNGRVNVTMKNGYVPRYISLAELKKKYIKNLKGVTLFLLNDQLVHDDYNEYLIDEKFILQIEVDLISKPDNGETINFVKLITRTEENVKKANQIWLRGE